MKTRTAAAAAAAAATPAAQRRPAPRGEGDGLRLAAIDVGSNSLHMLVVQVGSDGSLGELARAKEMVGLGRASFPSHRLSTIAMERALLTLRRFMMEVGRWNVERVLTVATSAVREAENGGEFIERVRNELGLHVRVVSARDEARLIYHGVRRTVDWADGNTLIVDVGGGSVEFVVADRTKPLLLESRKLGAARMTARFIKSDPAEPREVSALLAHYEAELAPLAEQVRALAPVRVIGTSGTLLNLAAMADGAARSGNGDAAPVLEQSDHERLVERLLPSRAEERAAMKGLDDQRKDQVLAGALLVGELFKRFAISRIEISRSALREGILAEYLARHRPELELRREVPEPRRRAIYNLGHRCHWHREHGEQVARLCGSLFHQLRGLHGLGAAERELIEYGALLHDIGALIGRAEHHKHSAYLIRNGDLRPFTADEVRTIACIARYHRKAPPAKRHALYAALPKRLRRTVRVGAALLRVADGLDRTNCSVVTDVKSRTRPDHVELLVESRGDAELEIWSAQSRGALFERVFDRRLVVAKRA
jgi:exopolyphosphatase/guanosine-5'-triphosphate,3'-diphosphate pyrophosphatase